MFNTLYARLVAVLVGFALIMAAAFVLVIRYSDQARRLEMSQSVYRSLANEFVRQTVVPRSGESADYAAFTEIFNRIKVINPRINAYLVGESGEILASSGPPGTVRRTRVNLEPIRTFLSDKARLPILGEDPADAKSKRVFSAARVDVPGHREAYLYLVLRGARSDSAAQPILQSYALQQYLMVFGGALALALIASALLIGIMTRRLRRLARVMDRFRESGFGEQPARRMRGDQAGDDIDQLAATFREMADRIIDQMNELKRTDSMRRELVANISHDLRTPLALLQGYLETLQLKGDRLSAEDKLRYLEIALSQSEHLSELVAKLFELAKLDSERVDILPEPFVLADLVQDVVQQFELAAENKGIRIAASLPQDMPLVTADIGLIERVLRNLIENSLRYTPSGGEIRVVLTAGADRATIEVTDTGPGIAPEDLPRIFDRFYRGEKSRSDASSSAGLGLAITKRILELHHSAMAVESAVGQTTFRFTLAYDGGGGDSSPTAARQEATAGDNEPARHPIVHEAWNTRSTG